MTIETWLYFCLAVLILTASPGPSSLLCMTKGVTQGRGAALYTAFGSLLAISTIMTLSFTGLGLIISSSELVFSIVKYLGAAYLIYLGIKAFTSKQDSYQISSSAESVPLNRRKHFVSGFIVGASNPKAILFFSALFPQFIDPQLALLPQYLVFAATFVVFELTWLSIYGYLGAKSSAWILSKGRAKLFNRLSGSVFVGAGALLSTTSRA
ncbi:LysE family translocator [Alginatibacterium sediminis]|uniref:LysE family translocator n=1 Tax=Alginatibacterium sediminis TaxID=2164068 RepID=A0A420E9Q2_9ALTE|nr:LysE family translocator [Alginatibacterium sediminis]RKF17406.1 LysE family translocator [Alginatibacterium sediminis]